ncbi:MAG: dTDP-4-dehydrorhamnose reductase [Bacteroidales bacterium]|nr:dTDP-4-dehydrorhamnose reductase [Bacteroidales bacterium]
MTKILITGANGQLGRSIQKLAPQYPSFDLVFTDVDELNITDYDQLEMAFNRYNPDGIINCAAYTDVDKAQEDQFNAEMLNTTAVRYISEYAHRFNTWLVHISSDYVFDGQGFRPYVETDPTKPFSFYGKTKLEGEYEMRENAEDGFIIRTSWLYSEFGHNFVKTMLKLGRSKEELHVVFDQVGTPTYATDLARAILDMLSKRLPSGHQTYHFSNEGVTSWYDFALEIMELAGISIPIKPIESKDYPFPTPRPHYSVLNKAKIKRDYNITIPHWKASLRECLKELSDLKGDG